MTTNMSQKKAMKFGNKTDVQALKLSEVKFDRNSLSVSELVRSKGKSGIFMTNTKRATTLRIVTTSNVIQTKSILSGLNAKKANAAIEIPLYPRGMDKMENFLLVGPRGVIHETKLHSKVEIPTPARA